MPKSSPIGDRLEKELKLKELRAIIDEGDRAYEEGRVTVVDEPKLFAADIIARGRARAGKRPANQA